MFFCFLCDPASPRLCVKKSLGDRARYRSQKEGLGTIAGSATIGGMHYPLHLVKLIELLKRLPGVGSKSAERFAFEMLTWSPDLLSEMGATIDTLPAKISHCGQCGCLMQEAYCPFCDNAKRDTSVICVIASPRDAFAMERTREYRGLYHVLGGMLSPIHGQGPDSLSVPALAKRMKALQVKELVIALDSTLEGDATALYLKQELDSLAVQISRLAFGLPMGSSLDYVDGDTLARALSGRRSF
jgi:recombination protein RecR